LSSWATGGFSKRTLTRRSYFVNYPFWLCASVGPVDAASVPNHLIILPRGCASVEPVDATSVPNHLIILPRGCAYVGPVDAASVPNHLIILPRGCASVWPVDATSVPNHLIILPRGCAYVGPVDAASVPYHLIILPPWCASVWPVDATSVPNHLIILPRGCASVGPVDAASVPNHLIILPRGCASVWPVDAASVPNHLIILPRGCVSVWPVDATSVPNHLIILPRGCASVGPVDAASALPLNHPSPRVHLCRTGWYSISDQRLNILPRWRAPVGPVDAAFQHAEPNVYITAVVLEMLSEFRLFMFKGHSNCAYTFHDTGLNVDYESLRLSNPNEECAGFEMRRTVHSYIRSGIQGISWRLVYLSIDSLSILGRAKSLLCVISWFGSQNNSDGCYGITSVCTLARQGVSSSRTSSCDPWMDWCDNWDDVIVFCNLCGSRNVCSSLTHLVVLNFLLEGKILFPYLSHCTVGTDLLVHRYVLTL
jgi:hypothetical protein